MPRTTEELLKDAEKVSNRRSDIIADVTVSYTTSHTTDKLGDSVRRQHLNVTSLIAELSAKLRESEIKLYITEQGLESERETSRQYKAGWDEAERKLNAN